jgi:hypothetical protein
MMSAGLCFIEEPINVAHPVSVRIDSFLVEELRRVARRWSHEKNTDVTWCEALEVAVRRFLVEEKAAKQQGV